MSGKGVVGSLIGGVICSVLIMAGLLYFIGPILLPGLTEQDTDLQNKYDDLLDQYNDLLNKTLELDEQDLVLQYKYDEWNSAAYIFDDDLSYQKMEDTEINITISQDSRLFVEFSAIALLALWSSFSVRTSYDVSLVVTGVTNRTFMVIYYDNEPSGGYFRELTVNLHINLLTQSLPAGMYTIEVYWRSTWDATGTNSLSVAHAPTYNYTRTIFVQELKTI